MKALMEGTPQVPPHRQLLPEIVFRKLSEAEDIEAYLTTISTTGKLSKS